MAAASALVLPAIDATDDDGQRSAEGGGGARDFDLGPFGLGQAPFFDPASARSLGSFGSTREPVMAWRRWPPSLPKGVGQSWLVW
jgi:hypothetical protein